MQISHIRIAKCVLAGAVASAMTPGVAQAQTPQMQPGVRSSETHAKTPAEKTGEIVITGTRSEVVASPDRISFNVANNLQAQNGTVADALRVVPGVEVDLQGRVSLRGDSGVEVWIDGRPSALLKGESRGDVLMSMPAGQVQRVEVLTNPSAAFSPEGSGGIINLVSKKARKDATYGTVRATVGTNGSGGLSLSGAHSAGPLTATADVAYRRTNGEARATQFRSRLDPATGALVASRQKAQLDTTNSFNNGKIAVDYDLDKKNRLSAELGYGRGATSVQRTDDFVSQNLPASYDRISDLGLSQRAVNGRASWRHTLPGKDHELVADLTHARIRVNRAVEGSTTFANAELPVYETIRNDITHVETGAKMDYKKALGDKNSLNLGYQGTFIRADFDYLGARGLAPDALLPVPGLTNQYEYGQAIHAFYGTYRFALKKLDTQIGFRLEQADIAINQITDGVRFKNHYFRAYPTLNLTYGLPKNQQLRGSYSRRIQRPSPQDFNPYTIYVDPQNLRRGNPFLVPEVTDSFELGWNRRKGSNFYSLTGFYRSSRGGITDILSDLGGGVFLTSRANLATAQRAGVEAIANGKLTKTVSYNASATFLWNEIDSRIRGASASRSGTTGTLRANLDWQPTSKDFFQINGVYSGKQLLPQGYRLSSGILNMGYRRKVNDRLSLLMTAQDVLKSARQVVLFETPTIRDRLTQSGLGRMFLFGASYNVGNQGQRKRQEPTFDFQQGGVNTTP